MKAILACERNGGLGYRGSMPWPKQEKDLARFKELTYGSAVIMGRGTWESSGMPKPLPGRHNIIVTTSETPLYNVDWVRPADTTINQASDLQAVIEQYPEAWIIGGGQLVAQAWNQITELHLSHLRASYECDTFIDLEQLAQDFKLKSSQLCLTHNYEVWIRK